MKSRFRLLLVVALCTVAVDQATKYAAVSRLTSALDRHTGWARLGAFFAERGGLGAEVVVVPGYLSLRYTENEGAAWGALPGVALGVKRPLVLLATALALGFLAFMFVSVDRRLRALRLALAAMVGGALGNLLDRLVHGYVIDFVDLRWAGHDGWRWPTFNVADLALFAGLLLVARETFRGAAAARGPSGKSLTAGLPNS